MNKRCICGQSQKFPLCDGQHGTLDWVCSVPQDTHHRAMMIGSQSLGSLVEYLCHSHSFVNGHEQQEIQSCTELIVLYDGSGLEAILIDLHHTKHQQRRVKV